MIIKDKRKIKRIKKTFLKKIKPYEQIDKELENYVENMIGDIAVKDIALLGDDHFYGFAGFTENDNIRYIWIFRNHRGNNLGAKICCHYGVITPTKEIMNGIFEILKIGNKEPFFVYDDNTIWHLTTGFVITVPNTPLPYFVLSCDEYEYGKGTFKNLEAIIPVNIKDVDFEKLDVFLNENIKYIGKGRGEIEIPDILR